MREETQNALEMKPKEKPFECQLCGKRYRTNQLLKNIKFWQKRYLMVFYNSLKNCAKNSNHNKLEITSRGSPSVMLRLSLLMDSAFVYINCWAHFDGSIEKWRKNLNCYRKSSSTSFARFLSSLVDEIAQIPRGAIAKYQS